ncbi:hypothetical protein [Acinetobacter brisouii]|uniref:hypothetical protein n=1 Tax=Acinetobacter brisouii TaxID=396323 RepID=UPI00124DAC9F|nr:hypothetical protein [Acinetobacter brisouii]
MKALFLKDEIHELHWKMLKAISLIAGLLPAQHIANILWHVSDAESQIVLGFFALSLFYACASLGFIAALHVLNASMTLEHNLLEQRMIKVYQHVPMLFLAGVVSYLVVNFQY